MVDRDKVGRAGAGGGTKEAGDSLEARRKRLADELATHRTQEASKEAGEGKGQGYAQAVKLASEFVAGILVGAGLGYLIDRFVGTAPWGMIVFLLLGFCAGVLNVLRAVGAVSTPIPGQRTAYRVAERKTNENGPEGSE